MGNTPIFHFYNDLIGGVFYLWFNTKNHTHRRKYARAKFSKKNYWNKNRLHQHDKDGEHNTENDIKISFSRCDFIPEICPIIPNFCKVIARY